VLQGGGFGLIGDLIVGLIGAFIGDWLLPQLNIHLGSGIIALIVNAFVGAVVLLLILRLVTLARWFAVGPTLVVAAGLRLRLATGPQRLPDKGHSPANRCGVRSERWRVQSGAGYWGAGTAPSHGQSSAPCSPAYSMITPSSGSTSADI
jgi:uncharacterized membrane protein YeaQ/YmgE (transglycosylase-associated protein family)